MTLNNLGSLLEKSGESDEATAVSVEAIRHAEASGDEESRFLAKGWAAAAYDRYLAYLARREDADAAYRCLAAMREGPVRALGEAPGIRPTDAAEALAANGTQTSRRVCVVLAERVTEEHAIVAVLGCSPKRQLAFERVEGLTALSKELVSDLLEMFDPDAHPRPATTWQRTLRARGRRLWQQLPPFLQEALDPRADHDVLISGDDYWTMFPWEALVFGDGQSDWLGLHRPLVRWGPITAGGLGGLVQRPFGNGQRTAALVCAWNVPGQKELPGARQESYQVEKWLGEMGYSLLPGGRVLRGRHAGRQRVMDALAAAPAIIHYTGHGTADGHEEAMVLRDDDPSTNSHTLFGRKELEAMRVAGGDGRPLRNGPLVMLNSCYTGRSHGFGGQREDFAAALLRHGAQAVIASPTPVFDVMGQQFGTTFYDYTRGGVVPAADAFMKARKFVEKLHRDGNSPFWPAWMMLSYHGNPYAYLPHADGP